MKTYPTFFILLMMLLFNSCIINRYYLDSSVDDSINHEFKKVNLVVEGSLQTVYFLDSLANILKKDFQRHGIEVQKFVKHPLELKSDKNLQNEYALLVKNYQPDVVFTISEKVIQKGDKHQYIGKQQYSTNYVNTYFALEMTKFNEADRFWRAEMRLYSGSNLKNFSELEVIKAQQKILERLKSDGILK